MNCPCGSNIKYTDCCKVAHDNITLVETAEQLMRSRYTAFTMANGDYLMNSHHQKTRPIKEKNSIENWAKSVNWIRLEILNKTKGFKSDTEGTVTFNAYYFENGNVEIIHEKSAFEKDNGNWMYVGLAN
ncbi:Sec-C motif domain protein [Cellulophaga sp. HaHaR_3_176]|uniref:YchJ family protein n=1 Tax=Cellulophaga sp. HaHaR_3_176 TaxID=1942464 RepID=UPI001C1F4EAB|nr:YchJ family metal-binding protein [Cellulophaga sp. HaHaR_3_176]QWX83749.1 Sec-C motif domain protein [Cellulophaga sp. HaHaR_3_176]